MIIALSLAISIIDIRTHRIPHILNFLLLIALLGDMHTKPLAVSLTTFLLVALLAVIAQIGGGDIKLLAVLIFTEGRFIVNLAYLQGLMLAMAVAVISTIIYRRSITGSIALAPVILTPFLYLYLDM